MALTSADNKELLQMYQLDGHAQQPSYGLQPTASHISRFKENSPEEKVRTLALTKEGTICLHGEPFPTGTKGYLPHHCPGTSNSDKMPFQVMKNDHVVIVFAHCCLGPQ